MNRAVSVASRAVVFDFGAVLFRWQPLALLRGCVPELAADDAQARRLAAQVFQSLTPDSDWARFDLGQLAEDELSARIAARIGVQPAQVRRIVDAIPHHLQPLPDSVALLRRLQQSGHRMFFLSNMPAPYADHLERCNAFVAEFADGIFSARVGLIKPDAAIFALAESRFALDPARTLFIDDHPANVDAARVRGWQALRFADAAQAQAELAAADWLGV
ncbi:MAG: HAD family phosphatase [Rubrivivax sp.]